MKRVFGTIAIMAFTWTALDAAYYLGKAEGQHQALNDIKFYNAGAAGELALVRAVSGRAAPGDGGSWPSTLGDSGRK